MADWYYHKGDQQTGPITADDLAQLFTSGAVLPSDLVWQHGMSQWLPAQSARNLFAPTDTPENEIAQPSPAAHSTLSPAEAGTSTLNYFTKLAEAPDYARESLARLPPLTGSADHWPITTSDFRALHRANGHRRVIRGMALWFKISTWIMFIDILLLLMNVLPQRSRMLPPEMLQALLHFAFDAALVLLFYFAGKATFNCRRWAPLTLMILYSLGALIFFCAMLIDLLTNGSFAPAAQIGVMIVGTLVLIVQSIFSWMAYSAIPRYLSQPAWTVATLRACKL